MHYLIFRFQEAVCIPLKIAVIQCRIAPHRYTHPMKWRYTGGSDSFEIMSKIVLLNTVIGPIETIKMRVSARQIAYLSLRQ